MFGIGLTIGPDVTGRKGAAREYPMSKCRFAPRRDRFGAPAKCDCCEKKSRSSLAEQQKNAKVFSLLEVPPREEKLRVWRSSGSFKIPQAEWDKNISKKVSWGLDPRKETAKVFVRLASKAATKA